MKIVEVETVRVEEYAEFIAVLVKTDGGLIGLGETCFGPESVEAYIHEAVALLLRHPRRYRRLRPGPFGG
jgi:L-alanine-DL-glutamate epimerase-like enolase superfamily enzyme